MKELVDMKRARERVRDDASLVSDVASSVSSALGLDAANRTLGRNIVIAALDAYIDAVSEGNKASEGTDGLVGDGISPLSVDDTKDSGTPGTQVSLGDDMKDPRAGESSFLKRARAYGPLGENLLSDVFRKVTTRLRGALMQVRAMQEEGGEPGANEQGGGEGDTLGDGALNFRNAERLSGLGVGSRLRGGLLKKPTFQPRTQRGSLLGLDKRAAEQRAAKQQGNPEGGTPRHGGLSFTPQDEQDDDDDADIGSGGAGTGRIELGGDGFVKPAALKAAKDKGQESRRRYRSRPEPETPSHPGGVNREAKGKIEEKERSRRRSGGVEVVEPRATKKTEDGRGEAGGDQRDRDDSRRRHESRSGDGSRRERDGRDRSRDDSRDRRRDGSRDRRRDDSRDRRRDDSRGRSRDRDHDWDSNGRRRRDNDDGGQGDRGWSRRDADGRSSKRLRDSLEEGFSRSDRGRGRDSSPPSPERRERSRARRSWEDAATPRPLSGQRGKEDAVKPSPSSLGPRRMDGSRSDVKRSGLGLDESEWDEPERLNSTPLPSPGGPTSASGYGGSKRGGRGESIKTPMTGVTASPSPASSFHARSKDGVGGRGNDDDDDDDGGWDRPSPARSSWSKASPAPSMLSAREGR